MPFPSSWLSHHNPRAHHLWVERDDKGETTASGRIIIPDNYRRGVKLATGVIRRVGHELHDLYRVEQRVFMPQGVVKTITFGETKLYVVTPQQILAVIHDNLELEYGRPAEGIVPVAQELYLLRSEPADEGVATARGADRGLAE